MADEFDREQLLGYLLGALEDGEQEAIERRLPDEPRLRRDLARMKASLRPLRQLESFSAPAGLAARTCRMVALWASPPAPETASRPAPRRETASRMSPESAPAGSAASWTWSDLAVVATVLVAVSLALFPVLYATRTHSRMVACQDKFRQMGVGYTQFSQHFPHDLPNAIRPQSAALPVSYAVNRQSERISRNILLDDGRVLLIRGDIPVRPSDQSPLLRDDESPIAGGAMLPVVLVSQPAGQ